MPTVPQYTRQVTEAPLPAVRVPASAPGETFSSPFTQALPSFTQASAQHDEYTQKIEAKAKFDADQLAVNTAERAASDARIHILQNPDTGVLNLKGINALQALPKAQEAWQKATSEIAGALTNDDQKAAFARIERGHYDRLTEQVAAHTSAEMRRSDIDTTNSFLQDGLQTVNDTPEQAAAVITDARKRLIAFGGRQGWTPEELQYKAKLHVSDIHAAAISALIQRGDYDSAKQAETYLKANRGELLGKQRDDAEALVDAGLAEGGGLREADRILGLNQQSGVLPSQGQVDGQVAPGNIDLTKRPRVKNADGSVSTVRSISIEEDGKTILIPTVVGNKVVSDDAAIAHYKATGENLGTFKDEQSATTYAKSLHEAQGAAVEGRGNGVPRSQPITMLDALTEAEKIKDPKQRKAATDAIVSHFAHIETAKRIDRQQTFDSIAQELETSGGRINKASPAWLKISEPEREQLLHRQDQLLYPKEHGDDEKYLELMNMATLPNGRAAFLAENIVSGYPQLSTSQRAHLLNLQRQYAGKPAIAAPHNMTEIRRQDAADRALLKADLARVGAAGLSADALQAEEQRLHRFYAARQSARHGAVADAPQNATTVTSSGPSGDVHLGVPGAPDAPPMLTPAKQATPAMLADVERKGEGYATYLRSLGYFVPPPAPAKPDPIPLPTTKPKSTSVTIKRDAQGRATTMIKEEH